MDHFKGKRILVTGAGGFVGANLADRLHALGADVHAMIRPESKPWRLKDNLAQFTMHAVDLANSRQIDQTTEIARPEIVFHTAAAGVIHGKNSRREILNTNLLGTLNLLEAAAKHGCERIVCTGGSSEYGSKRAPMKETDRLDPQTFYGMSKAAQTLLTRQFSIEHTLPLVILRLFSVYGYRESERRLVPTVMRAAINNQEISLTAPGFRRDFIFIEDVVEACLLSVQADLNSGEILNIGSGVQAANEDIVEIVRRLVPEWDAAARVGAYPAHRSDTSFWVADNRKAKRMIGWQPRHSLESGLRKTLAWFRAQPQDEPNPEVPV